MWKSISLYGVVAVAAYGGYIAFAAVKYGMDSLSNGSVFAGGAIAVVSLATVALAVLGIVKLSQSH